MRSTGEGSLGVIQSACDMIVRGRSENKKFGSSYLP